MHAMLALISKLVILLYIFLPNAVLQSDQFFNCSPLIAIASNLVSNKPNPFKLQLKQNLFSRLLGCNLKVFALFEAAIEDIEMKGLQLTK